MSFFGKKSEKEKKVKLEDWPSSLVILNEKTLKDFIEKYPLSLVDFWASWCQPCKAIGPRIRRISKIYIGKVAIGKINVEENQNVKDNFKISSIPNLQFFHFGKKVGEITGVKSTGDIKKIVDKLLDKYC